MKKLILIILLLSSFNVFSQQIGDCIQTVYEEPVGVISYKTVELEPAKYETYVITPAVIQTVKVSDAIYEWKEKQIMISSATTDYVKSNCGSAAGCSWKKISIPAKYEIYRYQVLIKEAEYEDVVLQPAKIGTKKVKEAVVRKIKITDYTEGGKVVLKDCDN